MMDVDAAITAELERLVPISATPDWESIVAAAGLHDRRRFVPLAAIVAVALVAIAFATPLGASIAHSLGGFSDWLTGQPGTPASQSEQAKFANANAHSWLGFPKDTKLRDLTTTTAAGDSVHLAGFRSGPSFCLRLTVSGADKATSTNCAPLEDLQRRDAPVRVLFADQDVGTGAHTAWLGLNRIHSAKLQITAGIVADGVRDVVLADEAGRHVVPVKSDAFLYVAADPKVAQRVKNVWAQTSGGLVRVPYVPAPFGFPGFQQTTATAPAVAVAAPLKNGRIAWLDGHRPHGQPLSALPEKTKWFLLGFRGGGSKTRILYGRVLTPTPGLPARIVLTLNAKRHGGPPAGLCTMLLADGSGGGGCTPYPQVFAKTPVSVGSYDATGSDQFTVASGAVADGVARLRAELANGQWLDIPFKDNVYIAQIPKAHLPALIVAYDAQGRTIGVTGPIGGFFVKPAVAQKLGKPKQLVVVHGPGGAFGKLYVGAATNGGSCWYVRTYIAKVVNGVMGDCQPAAWSGPQVQLASQRFFVQGRVAAKVTRVRVGFSDGSSETLKPVAGGYVLAALAPANRSKAITSFTGLDSSGKVVDVEKVPLPPKR